MILSTAMFKRQVSCETDDTSMCPKPRLRMKVGETGFF